MSDLLMHWAPSLNTFLIAFLGAYVLLRSRTWTGIAQVERLGTIESRVSRLDDRVASVEMNHDIQYQTLTASLDALAADLRRVSTHVGHISKLAVRTTSNENAVADLEQALQSFHDLGCGHANCPRKKS